jgi:2-oxoglutarate ferredoxin oxidoreductase subunit alpha
MLPVIILSDGYIANGAEPWLLPDIENLPEVTVTNHSPEDDFLPYKRDDETMARPWAIPGTPKLEHRIGGIEKEELTGNVSYDPENHHRQCIARAEKVLRIRNEFGPTEVNGEDSGDLLVVSWGSTYGAVWEGVRRCQAKGQSVTHLHLRWLNPLPADLGDILKRYKNVLIPEINLGQLIKILRAEYLVDAIGFNLIRGLPFKASEIEAEIQKHL